jgi:hypothetical protein
MLDALSLGDLHLFGPDDIPVRAEMEFNDGEIFSDRRNDNAVGLSTLWEVEGFGKLTLQTTRLPVREKFYNLNVEIARSRLLRISQKREEWGLTDLTLTENQHEIIDQAMELFIQALCHLDEPEKASQFADQSLVLSMKAGESLAMAHAKLFLDRRIETGGIKRHSFGCTIDPDRMNDQDYLHQIKANFHFVTVPVSWKSIEPKEQERQFEKLDACVNWLAKNRIAVRMGPLLSFIPKNVPDWIFIWENDFEQVREMAYEYITSVVERYNGKVQAWDVVSGLNANNCFNFTFEQIIEITRSATLAAKRASSRSLVLIELTEIWGEYYSRNQRTIPPMIYADAIYQSGIHFDGYSVEMGFGFCDSGMRTRDLLEMSILLDRFASFGKAVHLSQVQVPSQPQPKPKKKKTGNGNGFIDTGFWHEPWSESIQAQWLEQFYQMALSKPFVETITWADLADQKSHTGLLRNDMAPKPAFGLLNKLKKNLTDQQNSKPSPSANP